MFYDKFRSSNNNKKIGFKYLDEINSKGYDNMHLAWRTLFGEFIEKNNVLDMKEVFSICKQWNYERNQTSELKFFCSNIDWMIECKKDLIDWYYKDYERDGDEHDIQTIIKYRLEIVKLRNLSTIQEIKEALAEDGLL